MTSQAGFEPAFSIGAKYPKSSPPALVWPRDAANRKTKHVCTRRVNDAPLLRTSKKVRSVIGVRLAPSFPPTGPALSGTRLSGVSPGIRVSRSGHRPGYFKRVALRKIKNPPERLAREGPWSGLSISLRRDRSHEPCIRHRSAQSRSSVGRVCRIRGSSQGSCWFANVSVREGAGNTPARCACQVGSRGNIATACGLLRRPEEILIIRAGAQTLSALKSRP